MFACSLYSAFSEPDLYFYSSFSLRSTQEVSPSPLLFPHLSLLIYHLLTRTELLLLPRGWPDSIGKEHITLFS